MEQRHSMFMQRRRKCQRSVRAMDDDDTMASEHLKRAAEILELAMNIPDPKLRDFLVECVKDYTDMAGRIVQSGRPTITLK